MSEFTAPSPPSSSFSSSSTPSPKLQFLLAQVKALSPQKQRALSCIVGSCVADAATRPWHWQYDQAALDSTVGATDPAFWPVSQSPYYSIATGRNACYNELGSIVMMQALKPVSSTPDGANGDIYDINRYIEEMVTLFGPGTEYRDSFERRPNAYDPAKRMQKREPVVGPWQQVAVTEFMKELDAGCTGATHISGKRRFSGNPDSEETDGLVTTLPYIAIMACNGVDSATIQRRTADAATILSSNLVSLRHTLSAAMIIQSIILKGESELNLDNFVAMAQSVDTAVVGDAGSGVEELVTEELDTVFESLSEPHTKAVFRWGRTCANPGSFMGAILACFTASEKRGSFADSIRALMRAGGCNCSRANLAGAVLGASFGFNDESGISGRGIPIEWLAKTDRAEHLLELVLSKI